jgi:hypothetical protein
MTDRLFLMSPFVQKNETELFCFNKCGKIEIGVLEFCGGQFLFCTQDNCKFKEKEESFGIMYVLDDEFDITARKLIPIPSEVANANNEVVA